MVIAERSMTGVHHDSELLEDATKFVDGGLNIVQSLCPACHV